MSKPIAWLIRNWEGYEPDATDSETTAALARMNGAEVIPLCLASERDELLAVLKAIVELDDGDKPDLWHYQDEFNDARDAIARAES